MGFKRVSARDELLHRLRPASLEFAKVTDGVNERLWARVDRAQDRLVVERDVAHEIVGQNRDFRFLRRNASEDVYAVDAQHTHHLERYVRLTHGFVNEVDVSDAPGEFLDRNLLG